MALERIMPPPNGWAKPDPTMNSAANELTSNIRMADLRNGLVWSIERTLEDTFMHPTAACLAAFALFLPTKDPAKAPADLQGTWKLVAVESEGKANDLAEPPPRAVIRGNRLLYGGAEVAEIVADAGAS